ncbi:MAG: hypothetical protein KAG18_07755, partial [Sinobacterium sp.]|nr:hypothetical protein [Sinobacterium sp.]
ESTTQYAALTWHYDSFTPYYIYSEAQSTSGHATADYAKDEKYDVSDTQTLGLRYDLPKNISLNLEYSVSTAKEKDPSSLNSRAPKGMFVTSYWKRNSIGGWEQVEDNKAEIWTLAINWNF